MIYVDRLEYKKPNGRKFYCHMFGDTLDELHSFADKIGRKRCWFHRPDSGYLHYDLDEAFRNLALEAGAIEIETRDAIMARKLSKTITEYLENEGWSSHLFVEHAEYCFSELKELEFEVGRSVIYIKSGTTAIKAYAHYNGRSNEWVTFTDMKGAEIVSIHFTVAKEEFADTIRRLLNGQSEAA